MSDFTEKPSDPLAGNGPPPRSDLPAPQVTLPPAQPRGSLAITLIAAGIVAALVAAVMVFGLQAFRGSVERSQTLTQQGKLSVNSDEPVQVFYPIPYAGPPNVTLSGTNRQWVVIVEQKPDHFKVRKTGLISVDLEWKAEGVPADPNKRPPGESPPGGK